MQPLTVCWGVDPQVDTSARRVSFAALGLGLDSVSGEYGFIVQCVNLDRTASGSYEKAGIVVQVINLASSNYQTGSMKDAVGLDRRSMIRGTQLGRAWGGFDQAEVEKDSDGHIVACEVSARNFGSSQPHPDTPTSKYCHNYTAGPVPATAVAYVCDVGVPMFHHGWVARQGAFVPGGTVWALRKKNTNDLLFAVDTDGNLTVAGKKVGFKEAIMADGSRATVLVAK